MSRGLSLAPLVIVAALMWAPSVTFAANNALSDATVSPTSAPVGTAVELTVRYEGRFDATAVVANVGPLSAPMARISGTANDGTWRAIAFPPAGTWQVTFAAATLQGNAPTLAGPSITIGLLASVAPPASGDAPDGGAPASPLPTEPAAAPAATDATGTTADAPSHDASVTPSTPASSQPPGDGGHHAAPAGNPPSATSPSQPPAVAVDEPGASPAGFVSQPHATSGGEAAPPAGSAGSDDLVRGVLLIGLLGVGVIALLGWGAILTGVRRRRGEPSAVTEVASVLEDRRRRRGKVRLGQDPIVAAMGLPEPSAARRVRRRASQVNAGSGERESPPHPNRR